MTECDPVWRLLSGTLGWLGDEIDAAVPVDDALRIDRLAAAERLQSALEAFKSIEMVRFAQSQVAAQQARDVHPSRIGRGICDQIALAGHVSPTEGSRRLNTARDLVLDMPVVFGLLARGGIHPITARLIVGQLSHLDKVTRRLVDTRLAGADLAAKTPRAAGATAQRLAYQADPEGSTARARTARKERRVTLRPAPDTMSLLSGLLPVEQGVACYAALDAEVKRCRAFGDPRTRGQIMADTLVERVTGQSAADQIVAEVAFTMPTEALLDADNPAPSQIDGFSPLPAPLARDILTRAAPRSWWRRLFTRTTATGKRIVDDIDPIRRRFTGVIADLINRRDQTCRDPYCDAAIRHLDHIRRWIDGGASSAVNGRGVCERGNYTREMPGWSVELIDPDTHATRTTTPTGHRYLSTPPEPP